MTKDEILSMAREADLTDGIELDHEIEAVMRFAVLVAAKAEQDERAACATIDPGPLYILASEMPGTVWKKYQTAIRARGQ